MSERLVALVPMKAHSERVPNKNVREFNGRPLFHWILATLEATEAVDMIVVDTDSERIADEAPAHFDVTVIDRAERLRGDAVPMNDIIGHDISVVEGDRYLQTHCTNPLLRPDTVDAAVEAYLGDDRDSLFSVTPHKVRFWTEDVEPINHRRDELLPTQELDPLYEENSNIYLFTEASFARRDNRIGNTPMLFPMPAEEAVDIDYPMDFKTAEFLHRDRYGDEPDIEEVVMG